MLSPCVAEAIARGGYSKTRVKQYLYDHCRFPARRFEQFTGARSLCDAVQNGKFPAQFCESADPDRIVPLVWSPDDFIIAVSGDPTRDNCLLCGQNGFIGYPVSKRVQLPAKWSALLRR